MLLSLLFMRVDFHSYVHFGSMLHYSKPPIMQMYAGLILFRKFSDLWDWYRFLLRIIDKMGCLSRGTSLLVARQVTLVVRQVTLVARQVELVVRQALLSRRQVALSL